MISISAYVHALLMTASNSKALAKNTTTRSKVALVWDMSCDAVAPADACTTPSACFDQYVASEMTLRRWFNALCVCVCVCIRGERGATHRVAAVLQWIDNMLPCALVVPPSGTGRGMMLLTGQV